MPMSLEKPYTSITEADLMVTIINPHLDRDLIFECKSNVNELHTTGGS